MDSPVAPDFDELLALAAEENADVRDIRVCAEGKTVARALTHFETRRHHGLKVKVYELYSGKLHDYSRIFAADAKALEALCKRIVEDARALSCDVVAVESVEALCLPDGSRLPTFEECKVFDAMKAGGWRTLYSRKSVKRFLRDARKVGDYHVEISDGVLPLPLMEELARLHIWRWAFAGSGSPFKSNPHRIAQYRNFPDNKTYLRIMLGNEILACHYGMVYGGTLLWHTPVVNPKFLGLSPLRLLLAETAKWCEAKGLERIDFGLGDEAYKNGYCNATRRTAHFELSLTARGMLSRCIGKAWSGKIVRPMISAILATARKARGLFRRLRERWVFYQSPGDATSVEEPFFIRITGWCDFCDFAKQRGFQIFCWQWERFKNDASAAFVAMADETQVYSWGWETGRSDMAKGFPPGLAGMKALFDFFTPPEHRNKGWHTRLLRKLASEEPRRQCAIYAAPWNATSRRAIQKAGFSEVGKKRARICGAGQ